MSQAKLFDSPQPLEFLRIDELEDPALVRPQGDNIVDRIAKYFDAAWLCRRVVLICRT